MENGITVKDIIEYYSAKEFDDCTTTKDYLMNNKSSDPCEKLANDFMFLNGETEKDPELLGKILADDSNSLEIAKKFQALKRLDNYEFYKDLKRIGLKDKYIFEDGSDHICVNINLFEPFIEFKGKQIRSEKWHLLISFYASIDIANKTRKKVYEKKLKRPMNYSHQITATPYGYWRLSECFPVSSKSLRLWMAEASGVNVLNPDGKINWDAVTWDNVKNKLLNNAGN